MKELNLVQLHDLVSQGLVRTKEYPALGLTIHKYSRKVFYDALWGTGPMLEESRGLVLDSEGRVIMRPFRKVYNYLERDTCKYVDPNMKVRVVEKVNGFMAQAVKFAGQTLIGTTGTLDSDYSKLARKVIESATPIEELYGITDNKFRGFENYTTLFEICDPSDPHIIPEEAGAYLIGIRCNQTGELLDEMKLDLYAHIWGFKRPKHFVTTFEDAVAMRKTCKHEGYMVQSLNGEVLCKMKSHYYLAKKAFMRMGKQRCALMYKNPTKFKEQIDEEFYGVVDYITKVYTEEEWNGRTPLGREDVFCSFFAETADNNF
ncbi:RNA ligase [Vibrio phage vB_VpS_PG07]|uniref:RNA ligase n=1 Tax=Vibrio phage vB_VpS_PG07 TaxID=2301664 RepID=A0A385E7H5_9CAUD|nr:RNA ligase [Vibrio phage vB_VpS_PG07]AXQ66659.1 RNA ligase [Vibrio phage vB_VpS_PG07]